MIKSTPFLAILTIMSKSEVAFDLNSNSILIFQEVNNVTFFINDYYSVSLTNALIIRHYSRDEPKVNLFVSEDNDYLYAIFKRYLVHINKHDETISSFTHTNTEKKVNEQSNNTSKPFNRISLIAQFHSHTDTTKLKQTKLTNYPTYVVTYEFGLAIEEESSSEDTIQICYRRIQPESFLANKLFTFERPFEHFDTRACLLIERAQNDNVSTFSMQPKLIESFNKYQQLNRRIFSISKNGWLAVFIKHHPCVYILLEYEYLVFSDSMKDVLVRYKRTMDIGSLNDDQIYLKQCSIEQHGSSFNGMIVGQAVMHNESCENQFSIMGLCSAVLNFGYIQKFVTTKQHKTGTIGNMESK